MCVCVCRQWGRLCVWSIFQWSRFSGCVLTRQAGLSVGDLLLLSSSEDWDWCAHMWMTNVWIYMPGCVTDKSKASSESFIAQRFFFLELRWLIWVPIYAFKYQMFLLKCLRKNENEHIQDCWRGLVVFPICLCIRVETKTLGSWQIWAQFETIEISSLTLETHRNIQVSFS